MILTSLLTSGIGTTAMALGNWLGFDANNPVVKTVYICVVIAACVMGVVQLFQLDD